MKKSFFLFIGILSLMLPLQTQRARAFDQQTLDVKPFVTDSAYCAECHTAAETASFVSKTIYTCATFCRTCHGELGEHHPTGAQITKKIKEHLKLNERNRLMCYTCHDLNQQREDSKPWKSQSLFEDMFTSNKVHKTYYLPINNSKGNLCKTCH